MSTSIIQNQLEIYREHFLEHGDTPEGTYNQNDAIQNLRFERLIKNLDIETSSSTLHDVGCGICDLYAYLKSRNFPVSYSGTDIVNEMKALALQKYPDIEYHVRNILEDAVEDKYDYVVLTGTFNIPGGVSEDDWRSFSRAMITKMFSMARLGIAFNFVTSHTDYRHDDMFYENPAEVLDFCIKNLSRHVILDHGYPLYEYTVTVLKPEQLASRYPDQRLQKYLKLTH
ncbi:MAG: trans-aconitate 2-methyltransferase [Candidatus Methylacidiphilales bacterium]|nr:class I SAM-dependent methyltransferase [Candidatus Methylacidiphilales bacterium]